MEQIIKTQLPTGREIELDGNWLKVGKTGTKLHMGFISDWVDVATPRDYADSIHDIIMAYNTVLADFVRMNGKVEPAHIPHPESFTFTKSLTDFLGMVESEV